MTENLYKKCPECGSSKPFKTEKNGEIKCSDCGCILNRAVPPYSCHHGRGFIRTPESDYQQYIRMVFSIKEEPKRYRNIVKIVKPEEISSETEAMLRNFSYYKEAAKKLKKRCLDWVPETEKVLSDKTLLPSQIAYHKDILKRAKIICKRIKSKQKLKEDLAKEAKKWDLLRKSAPKLKNGLVDWGDVNFKKIEPTKEVKIKRFFTNFLIILFFCFFLVGFSLLFKNILLGVCLMVVSYLLSIPLIKILINEKRTSKLFDGTRK